MGCLIWCLKCHPSHAPAANTLLTDNESFHHQSPTDTEKDTWCGVRFKTTTRSVKVKWTSDYPRLSLPLPKSPNAHEHFHRQTRRCEAWIIDPTVPLRVRSAPWCNSPEDAWEQRQHSQTQSSFRMNQSFIRGQKGLEDNDSFTAFNANGLTFQHRRVFIRVKADKDMRQTYSIQSTKIKWGAVLQTISWLGLLTSWSCGWLLDNYSNPKTSPKHFGFCTDWTNKTADVDDPGCIGHFFIPV